MRHRLLRLGLTTDAISPAPTCDPSYYTTKCSTAPRVATAGLGGMWTNPGNTREKAKGLLPCLFVGTLTMNQQLNPIYRTPHHNTSHLSALYRGMSRAYNINKSNNFPIRAELNNTKEEKLDMEWC